MKDRLLSKIKIYKNSNYVQTDCWNWVGALASSPNNCRYGAMRVGPKLVKAHRISYEEYVGRIPEGWCKRVSDFPN